MYIHYVYTYTKYTYVYLKENMAPLITSKETNTFGVFLL